MSWTRHGILKTVNRLLAKQNQALSFLPKSCDKSHKVVFCTVVGSNLRVTTARSCQFDFNMILYKMHFNLLKSPEM